jgi:hypothetical protein
MDRTPGRVQGILPENRNLLIHMQRGQVDRILCKHFLDSWS